jgi:hypothetical protein
MGTPARVRATQHFGAICRRVPRGLQRCPAHPAPMPPCPVPWCTRAWAARRQGTPPCPRTAPTHFRKSQTCPAHPRPMPFLSPGHGFFSRARPPRTPPSRAPTALCAPPPPPPPPTHHAVTCHTAAGRAAGPAPPRCAVLQGGTQARCHPAAAAIFPAITTPRRCRAQGRWWAAPRPQALAPLTQPHYLAVQGSGAVPPRACTPVRCRRRGGAIRINAATHMAAPGPPCGTRLPHAHTRLPPLHWPATPCPTVVCGWAGARRRAVCLPRATAPPPCSRHLACWTQCLRRAALRRPALPHAAPRRTARARAASSATMGVVCAGCAAGGTRLGAAAGCRRPARHTHTLKSHVPKTMAAPQEIPCSAVLFFPRFPFPRVSPQHHPPVGAWVDSDPACARTRCHPPHLPPRCHAPRGVHLYTPPHARSAAHASCAHWRARATARTC